MTQNGYNRWANYPKPTFLRIPYFLVTILKQNEKPDRLQITDGGTEAVLPDLERLMDSYGDALLRLCFMYLKDRQLAEDAVQDTFIKVYRNYGRLDRPEGEKAWINRIAINVCKDMLRSAWRRRVNLTDELGYIPDEREQKDSADDTLLLEVMQMKPKYKEVILLFYYQDMKITEIASLLGAPESTISVRLRRARGILKDKLGGWYYDE